MQTLSQIQQVNRLEERPGCRILVPIDFSASTAEVLRLGRLLAEQFGALISLVHVIQPDLRGKEGDERTSLMNAMSNVAFQELSKLIDVLWPEEVTATITILQGDQPEVILDEARTSGAQFILLGIHSIQRRELAQILRTAPCPVILVPDSEHAVPESAEQYRPT